MMIFPSSTLSLGFFVGTCAITGFFQSVKRKLTKRCIRDLVMALERRVQRDEGGRGISDIFCPSGTLLNAALTLQSCSRVAIITGFPCLLDFPVPTETDGPPGACAIAKALLVAGKDVVLITDECNEEVLLMCAAATDLTSEQRARLVLQSFPPIMEERDVERFENIRESINAVVAIERAGPNKEGKYLTMRARDMTHLVAPLDQLFSRDVTQEREDEKLVLIGIGDGGNEVGMGTVYDKIVKSINIPNAETIACTVAADYLIVASVSNWGGYALAAAIGLVHTSADENGFTSIDESTLNNLSIQSTLQQFLPSRNEEIAKLQRMVDAGARDGMTKEQALMVDGMDLQISLDLIDEMLNI